MRTVFWSAKGGSGVTVTALGLGLATPDCLIVDLCGDAALALGVDEPSIGLLAWLHATQAVDASALDRLIINVRPGLALLPAGTTRPDHSPSPMVVAERFALLNHYLASRCSSANQTSNKQTRKQQHRVLMNVSQSANDRTGATQNAEMQWSNVIVDVGTLKQNDTTGREVLLEEADRSLLVVKSCFLAVHATVGLTSRAQGIVVVCDEERRITDNDIAAALELPVVATVVLQPAVARAVDAGLLVARLPRAFVRSLEALQPSMEPAPSSRRILNRAAVAS